MHKLPDRSSYETLATYWEAWICTGANMTAIAIVVLLYLWVNGRNSTPMRPIIFLILMCLAGTLLIVLAWTQRLAVPIICPNSRCDYCGKPRAKSACGVLTRAFYLLFLLCPASTREMFQRNYRYYCPKCETEIS